MIKGQPYINAPRERRNYHLEVNGTCKGGVFIPFHWEEVLPGLSLQRMNLNYIVRFLTPKTAVMDNARVSFQAWFVPYRIIFNQFKNMMGENDTTYWTQVRQYLEPTVRWFPENSNGNVYAAGTGRPGSIGDYLGLPMVAKGQLMAANGLKVTVLPLRAYQSVWNYWIRDEKTMNASVFSKEYGDVANGYPQNTGDEEYTEISRFYYCCEPLPATRVHGYFTDALPAPQKGDPQAAIGPVGPSFEDSYPEWQKLNPEYNEYGYDLEEGAQLAFVNPGNTAAGHLAGGQGLGINTNAHTVVFQSQDAYSSQDSAYPANLWAAISVEAIRKASFMQQILERLAIGGSRYASEFLKTIFGIGNSEALLSEPEYLGGIERLINMTEVMSNANTASDGGSAIGENGAYSKTTGSQGWFNHTFSEHGVLLYTMFIRHDDHFSQGLERKWTRFSFWDKYLPQGAGQGYQPIYKREVNAAGLASDDKTVFAYRPYGSDYIHRLNRSCGYLNPVINDALADWTYQEVLPQNPVFNSSFQEADSSGFARVSLFEDAETYPAMQFLFDVLVEGTEISPVLSGEYPGMRRI